MFLNKLLISYICLIITKGQNWRQQKPLVQLSQGILEGRRVYTDAGKIINTYLGVPYAAPPLHDLRFAPPQKHEGWNGTLDAAQFGPRCPQLPLNTAGMSEDCLYLNIWTPENAGMYSSLPVIIFLEGKQFSGSSLISINGQDLASEGFVIVTVNYRLNVFGFFCLGTAEARGNLGLLDQYFAMLWVKENIYKFGGEAEKITLFGHGSGADSALFHMISPRTNGFFQRIITISGSIVAPWLVQNDPIIASKQIIHILGCDTYTTNSLACLRAKKTEHILQALVEYSESFVWNDHFFPVVDTFLPGSNRYLPMNPVTSLRESTFPQVPILTGISKPIAGDFGQWLELARQGYPQLMQYIEKAKIPEIMRLHKFSSSNKNQIFELIKWKYFSSDNGVVQALFDELKDLDFEAKIEAPHYLQLSHLVSSYVQPIYVYFLDEDFVVDTPDSAISAELLLLFGPVLLKQIARRSFNINESNLSRQFKRFWTNFVMFGNPVPNNQNDTWPKYTTSNYFVKNFQFNVKNSITKNERVAFWNQLLPILANMKNNISNNIPRELQNSPDPAAGFRNAMYTLVALVIALLALLLICVILLKKRSQERKTHLHMGY